MKIIINSFTGVNMTKFAGINKIAKIFKHKKIDKQLNNLKYINFEKRKKTYTLLCLVLKDLTDLFVQNCGILNSLYYN